MLTDAGLACGRRRTEAGLLHSDASEIYTPLLYEWCTDISLYFFLCTFGKENEMDQIIHRHDTVQGVL